MNRCWFVKSVTRATLFILLATPGSSHLVARPNIFMIVADDAPKRDFGCYGNKVVKTPNIDKLAAQGMRFENMLTASPSCSPSRSTLYTGLYPIRHGGHANHSQVKPGTKSMAHYMAALGYRVILMGKKHVEPKESFPFEYYRDDTKGRQVPGEDLRRILANPDDKPFCIILAKFSAHSTWPHNRYGYNPETLDIPAYHVDTPETREMRARYYSKVTEMDEGVGQVMDWLKEHDLEENTLTIYTSDHGSHWPHQKWNLYEAGVNVPFIARWPGHIQPGSVSDALLSYVDILPTFIDVAGGEPPRPKLDQVARSKVLDGKSFLPVLLGSKQEHHTEVFACFTWGVMGAYPMRAVRTKTHKYIWNIDSHFRYPWPADTGWWGSFPNTLETPPRELPMSSPWSNVLKPLWRSWLQKATTDPGAAARVRAEQFRPSEELYDLHEDPDELNNLAGDPQHKGLMATLRNKLNNWMQQQGDLGDSAYHKEEDQTSFAIHGQRRRFLDEFYGRQVVINATMWPITLEIAGVELTCPVWRAEIRYTVDGSEPTRHSRLYSHPFRLEPPATLKAKGFFEGGETPLKVVDLSDIDYRFHYQYHYKPTSY